VRSGRRRSHDCSSQSIEKVRIVGEIEGYRGGERVVEAFGKERAGEKNNERKDVIRRKRGRRKRQE
jgi:hypothetical protein